MRSADYYLENMPLAFCAIRVLTDEAGEPVDFEFLYSNKAHAEMTGYTPEELIGKYFANSHFPRPAGPHFPARQGHIKRPVLESGTGVQGREGLHPASL